MPELLPFQKTGAAFLASKRRAALLDEPGVGKTAQAIRGLDTIGAERIVVVAPAEAHRAGVWRNEYAKFGQRRLRFIKGQTEQDREFWLRGKSDVLLLSYEMATNWASRLKRDVIDCLIFDEGHRLKNLGALRTRALIGPECDGRFGLAEWAVNGWWLTGTANPNDAADCWSMLRFCGATRLNKDAFCTRYYRRIQRTYSASHKPRPEMLDELRQVIRSCSLRRTERETDADRPPIFMTTTEMDGDTEEIRTLLQAHPNMERAILEAVETGGLSFLDSQHIATLRRLVGEAKAPAFANLLVSEIADGLDKVVVFGIHVRALQIIKQTLAAAGVVAVYGREDDNAVERFQHDPQVKVYLGNIVASGTAITLTAAARVIMFESSWAPMDNYQAIKRVHRKGQTRKVHAQWVTLANSIDERVSATLARKTAAIAQIEGPREGP